MGERRKKKYPEFEQESVSDSPSCSEESGGGGGRRRKERGGSSRAERKKKEKRRRSSEKEKDRERRESKERRRRRDREVSRRSSRKEERRSKRRRDYSSEEEEDSEFGSDSVGIEVGPEVVVEDMLAMFAGVVDDLKQLLQMIDNGQAVDIKGISEKALVSHMRKLYLSLNVKESNGVYLLPADRKPVLVVIGPLIEARVGSGDTIIKA